MAWTTGATADHAAPRWRSSPRRGGGRNRRLGCGIELFVDISVAVAGDEPVQVLAEVTSPGSALTRRYILGSHDGQVTIGHGMCGGPFNLEPGRRYSVKLTALDAAGNRSPAPGPPIEIVGPAPEVAKR